MQSMGIQMIIHQGKTRSDILNTICRCIWLVRQRRSIAVNN